MADCPKCGRWYGLSDPKFHVCPDSYRVVALDRLGDDGEPRDPGAWRTIDAYDVDEAVEEWGRDYDAGRSRMPIVSGETVHVLVEQPDGTRVRSSVSGRMDPTYDAGDTVPFTGKPWWGFRFFVAPDARYEFTPRFMFDLLTGYGHGFEGQMVAVVAPGWSEDDARRRVLRCFQPGPYPPVGPGAAIGENRPAWFPPSFPWPLPGREAIGEAAE